MTTQSNGTNLLVQGRIVWTSGNLFEGKKKIDDRTKQPVMNQNGDQVVEYGFGLAIPKIDPRTGQHTPEFTKVMQTLQAEALTLYPGGQFPPQFAWKFKDGDGVDHNGQPFNTREGHAGHIILACVTRIPIKYFRFEGGNNILVNDGIKNGDYVNVQVNIKAHPAHGQGKPGLYVNPSAVQLIQAGKEIINTPSGDQMFGVNAPVYAGQVEAPVAPTMPNVGAPAPMGMPGMVSAPVAPAPTMAPPTPNYGVLPPQHQPAAAPVPGGMPGGFPMPGMGR